MNNNECGIIGRYLIKGEAVLDSPLIIGTGHSDYFDIEIVRDSKGNPVIPGTSIAGVLKELLKDSRWGSESEGIYHQSSVRMYDLYSFGKENSVSYRDGLKIDKLTGTSEKSAKYDYETVDKGSRFHFETEIILRNGDDFAETEEFVMNIVSHMIAGIKLGAMSSKGFGCLRLENPSVYKYDFNDSEAVKSWLGAEEEEKFSLELTVLQPVEIKKEFTVLASFYLEDTMLIASESSLDFEKDTDEQIRSAHITSGNEYVIPGTSIKGAVRRRSELILEILGIDSRLNNILFGTAGKNEEASKSLFYVEESEIMGSESESGINKSRVQTRIKVDRFTGGTVESALFTEYPVRSGEAVLKFGIISNSHSNETNDAMKGILLLILKDLMKGELSLGGGKSIGRGYLIGHEATITDGDQSYKVNENFEFSVEDEKKMNDYIGRLKSYKYEESI